MALTNAERQKLYRERQKQNGVKKVSLELTADQLETLKDCYEWSNDPGETFGEFLTKVILRGAVFTANAGRPNGSKVKRDRESTRQRYAVTETN